MSAERPSPSSEERAKTRPYHHANLRAALIEAGLAILAEEGGAALTLRAAARRVGVSHSAPYRHFADQEALLAAIAQEGFDALTAQVEEASERFRASPPQRLEEACMAYVRFARTHPNHLRVMFGDEIRNPQAHPGLVAAGTRAFNALVAIIRDGQVAGQIVAGRPQALAASIWAHVHGLSMLLIGHRLAPGLSGSDNEDELVRSSLRLQYTGLEP
jgi:AcrR family transcriptional regulator